MSILIAIAALGGLTLVLAVMLIVANKKLYVYEDPRIDTVEDMLPHANCGACGTVCDPGDVCVAGAFGPCGGQVVPRNEACGDDVDDDC